MTRQEIEKRMDELARKYVETRAKEIPQELYQLARELEKIEKLEKKWAGEGLRPGPFFKYQGILDFKVPLWTSKKWPEKM